MLTYINFKTFDKNCHIQMFLLFLSTVPFWCAAVDVSTISLTASENNDNWQMDEIAAEMSIYILEYKKLTVVLKLQIQQYLPHMINMI